MAFGWNGLEAYGNFKHYDMYGNLIGDDMEAYNTYQQTVRFNTEFKGDDCNE
ncbi:hypothetical protein ACG2LH_04405 [Zhouia sp. PK063]|uniref:hypothetical protein n=1 Tax=Zhouia sp. PK063 TaxID=3373602 RepID=UPI0037B8B2CE